VVSDARDILGFALIVVCAFAFVVVRFPFFRQAIGFCPDWDCKIGRPKATRFARRRSLAETLKSVRRLAQGKPGGRAGRGTGRRG
jgi:hypothetical protein